MARNKYLDSVIPNLYQRQAIDLMIYTFIDTYKLIIPSVTIKEAAEAFMARHDISEDLLSASSIITTYERTAKDYHNARRQQPKPGEKG